MKRIIAIAIFMAGTAGMIFAQSPGEGAPGAGNAPVDRPGLPEKTTIQGMLGLRQGRIVLESGGSFYHVPGLGRLAGFIDGLREGAAVSIEGRVFTGPAGGRLLRAEKLTIGERSYDLAPAISEGRPGSGRHRGFPRMGWGPGPNRGGDRGQGCMRGYGPGGPPKWNGRGPEGQRRREW
ncbi:MAG: hypothetical protein LBG43_06500 [Treponema sp.]|jgi:hypothetical protein|nr:hypothetical protein [Treponema sp.]